MSDIIGQSIGALGQVLTGAGQQAYSIGMKKYDDYKRTEMLKMQTDFTAQADSLIVELEKSPPSHEDGTSFSPEELNTYAVEKMRGISDEIGKYGAIEDIRNDFSSLGETIIQEYQPKIANMNRVIIIERDQKNHQALLDKAYEKARNGDITAFTLEAEILENAKNNRYLDQTGPITFTNEKGIQETITPSDDRYASVLKEQIEIAYGAGKGYAESSGSFERSVQIMQGFGDKNEWDQEKKVLAENQLKERYDAEFSAIQGDYDSDLLNIVTQKGFITPNELLNYVKQTGAKNKFDTLDSYNNWYRGWLNQAMSTKQPTKNDRLDFAESYILQSVLTVDPDDYNSRITDVARKFNVPYSDLIKQISFDTYTKSRGDINTLLTAIETSVEESKVGKWTSKEKVGEVRSSISELIKSYELNQLMRDEDFRELMKTGSPQQINQAITDRVAAFTEDEKSKETIEALDELFEEYSERVIDGISDKDIRKISNKFEEYIRTSNVSAIMHLDNFSGVAGGSASTLKLAMRKAYIGNLLEIYDTAGIKNIAVKEGENVEEQYKAMLDEGVVMLPMETGGFYLAIPYDSISGTEDNKTKFTDLDMIAITGEEYLDSLNIPEEYREETAKAMNFSPGKKYLFIDNKKKTLSNMRNDYGFITINEQGNPLRIDFKQARDRSDNIRSIIEKQRLKEKAVESGEVEVLNSADSLFRNNLIDIYSTGETE